MSEILRIVTASLIAITACADVYAAASFQGLGRLPGEQHSEASAISADGSAVVGVSSTGASGEAFLWTAVDGIIGLGDLPGGDVSSSAGAVSADGTVIAGNSKSASGTEAFRWTSEGGMVGLGDLSGGSFHSTATGISADGSVIVGGGNSALGNEAFRWTSGDGMVGLGDFPGGVYSGNARGISADGSVIAGASWGASGTEAFRWNSDTDMVGLGDLPGGDFKSFSMDISADGLVIVGASSTVDPGDLSMTSRDRAFRWTQATGMVNLGSLDPFSDSNAVGVSANGSRIVGNYSQGAFIWDAMNGMRDLHDVLVNDLGLDLAGWSNLVASGISDDGLTIVGRGNRPDPNDPSNPSLNYREAFIATLPEPGTLALIALGLPALIRRRR